MNTLSKFDGKQCRASLFTSKQSFLLDSDFDSSTLVEVKTFEISESNNVENVPEEDGHNVSLFVVKPVRFDL